jgi:ectoine hydroxylase-related dioxygenase (phytanoyl-CoA dioxygenase family)
VTTGRALTAPERDSLEREGYLLVPSLLADAVLVQVRSRLGKLVRQTVAAWDADPDLDTVEAGVVHAKLELADSDFVPLCQHRLLAEAATALLRQAWHASALTLRAPLPGCGHQGLHPDFAERRTQGRPWQTLSAMWCITAFTRDNGPLRVIPGSHRVSQEPIDVLAFGSGMGPHPDEVKIIAPAGSVILFNSADLWLRHAQLQPRAAPGCNRGLHSRQLSALSSRRRPDRQTAHRLVSRSVSRPTPCQIRMTWRSGMAS